MGASTTFWAPVHRLLARVPIGSSGVPLNAAPSQDFLGNGIQDHRLQYNLANSPTGAGVVGWYGTEPAVINQVPSTIATNNIAAVQNAVSGTPLTLVASTGAGITVLSSTVTAQFWPTQLTLTAGVVIDTVPALNRFGTAGNFTTAFYDRRVMIGRAVSITGVTSGTGGNFTVVGYDVYGYPMTETIAATAGATTKNGKKAFKAIISVTPAFSDAHNYAVGTADIFGIGIMALNFPNISVWWNDTVITASTGFVGADTTSPATATTGDVRGTYAVQSASDGTKRLFIIVRPSLSSLTTNPTTGLFGVAQV